MKNAQWLSKTFVIGVAHHPEGLLTSQGPQFQFCPRISATSFCKYKKTFYFAKFCRINVILGPYWAPTSDGRVGGGGKRAPCAPLAASLRTNRKSFSKSGDLTLACFLYFATFVDEGERHPPPPTHVSKLSVIELSGKANGLLSTSTRE